jgi:hypothetical protein
MTRISATRHQIFGLCFTSIRDASLEQIQQVLRRSLFRDRAEMPARILVQSTTLDGGRIRAASLLACGDSCVLWADCAYLIWQGAGSGWGGLAP